MKTRENSQTPALRGQETLLRVAYGVPIFIAFTIFTLCGSFYMACFILLVAISLMIESWVFTSSELQKSLTISINCKNFGSPQSEKLSSEKVACFMKIVRREFIAINIICAFYHTSWVLHSLYPLSDILRNMHGTSSFFWIPLHLVNHYHFYTSLLYLAFFSFASINIIQSASKDDHDVMLYYHFLALGVQHILGIFSVQFPSHHNDFNLSDILA